MKDEDRDAPVTGDLSPLTNVSPLTRLLNTSEVTVQALRTAARATCCSVARSSDIALARYVHLTERQEI